MSQHETRGAKPKYPFKKMKIGESRLFKGEGASQGKCPAYNAAKRWGDYNGKRFEGRKEPGRPGYVRIWRVE